MKFFIKLFLVTLFAVSCKKAERPTVLQPVSNNPKEIIFTNYEYINSGQIEHNVKLILTRQQDKIAKIDWYRKNKNTGYTLWFTEDKTTPLSLGYSYDMKYAYENGKLSKTTRTDTYWDEIEEVSYSNYLNEVPQQIHVVSKNSATGDLVYSEWNQLLSVNQTGDIQMISNDASANSGSIQIVYGNSFNPLKGLLGELPVFSGWYENMGRFDPVWHFSKKNPLSMIFSGNIYYQFEYAYDLEGRPIDIKTYNTDKLGSSKTLYRDIQIKY
ncbi:MAG: hypothetical protein WBP45_02250 [Daejeonella sp.]